MIPETHVVVRFFLVLGRYHSRSRTIVSALNTAQLRKSASEIVTPTTDETMPPTSTNDKPAARSACDANEKHPPGHENNILRNPCACYGSTVRPGCHRKDALRRFLVVQLPYQAAWHQITLQKEYKRRSAPTVMRALFCCRFLSSFVFLLGHLQLRSGFTGHRRKSEWRTQRGSGKLSLLRAWQRQGSPRRLSWKP